MHLGYNNCDVGCDLDGVELVYVKEEKELGVIISNDLKWEKHCSEAVSKANQILV